MIGVPPLHDGSAAFHTMFSFFSRLQVVGRFFESLMPLPSGPRHCGQFSFAPADKPAAKTAIPETQTQRRRADITEMLPGQRQIAAGKNRQETARWRIMA